MEQLELRIVDLEKKVDAMTKIVNRLYKVFLAGVILTVVMFIVPLIGLLFVIPSFISTYTSMLSI